MRWRMIRTGPFALIILRNRFRCLLKTPITYQWYRMWYSQQVRVRFAPSPTGFLHIGGLRTALYNFLFAKKMGGCFILRIEDTDQERLVPGSKEQLENILYWTGLVPDEGPSAGGDKGPYVQSERLALYKERAAELLEKGAAYRCFCTESRLRLYKREALRLRQIPRYDNRCRSLTKHEIQERLNNSQPYAIRFKIDNKPLTFQDVVCGPITLNISESEGDPIILKSNGFPTYHLACVVDDHDMNITHVLRGAEWQVSTAKHIMMYHAFGWKLPEFAHLPLILNSDGTKLSKRQGDVDIQQLRDQGFFPEAILNFTANFGGGFGQYHNEVCSLDDLVQKFQLKKVNTNACHLELERLKDCNKLWLSHFLQDELQMSRLILDVRELIQKTLGSSEDMQLVTDDYIRNVLYWSKDTITRLSELVSPSMRYLWMMPAVEPDNFPGDVNIEEVFPKLLVTLKEVPEVDFQRKKLAALLKSFCKTNEFGYKGVMMLIRIILSGYRDGPSVGEILEILGQENSCFRLQHALLLVRNNNESAVSYQGKDNASQNKV